MNFNIQIIISIIQSPTTGVNTSHPYQPSLFYHPIDFAEDQNECNSSLCNTYFELFCSPS
jgi:hypothetical protein